MSDEKQVTEADVFKSIGRLDEATEVIKKEFERSAEDEEDVVNFFTIIGRIIKGILMR